MAARRSDEHLEVMPFFVTRSQDSWGPWREGMVTGHQQAALPFPLPSGCSAARPPTPSPLQEPNLAFL